MKIRRKVEIEVRQLRSWVVQNDPRTKFLDCSICGGGPMLTVAEAEQAISYTVREIYRLIESGRVHFAETATGEVYVCSRSLAEITEVNK